MAGRFAVVHLSVLTAVLGAGPRHAGAQAADTVRVDSTHIARGYELSGLTVRVARPTLTTGGSSAVEVRLDSVRPAPSPTMEEVLRAMPLVVIRRNSRGEAQPAIRGSEERQIGIFLDGIPLTIGWDHRTDLSIVPLTAAQGVRLVRGLSSVLYGPNTLGGVVEVDVARSPRRLDGVTPLRFGVAADHNAGANLGAGAAHLVDGSGGQWLVRVGAGYEDSPGISVPEAAVSAEGIRPEFLENTDGLRLNSDVRRIDGYLATRYRTDGGAWVAMTSAATDVERGVPPEAHQDRPRLWRYPDQRRLVSVFSVGSGPRPTRVGAGDVELSVGVDLGYTRIDQYASAAYETVAEREESDSRTLTARLEAEHTLLGRGELRVAATYADVRHDETLTPGGAFSYRQRLWSVGAESEWRLGPSGGTRLSLGAVADGADTPESGDKPPLDPITDYGARLGLSSLLSDGILLHAGVSRRARFPSLRELYSGALGRFVPNPNLRAERLWGAEAGFTILLPGDVEFQAVGFHQRLQGGIVRTSVTGEDGARRFQRVNQDEVRSTGAELLAVGTLGVVTLSGDLTLQRVRGRDPDGTEVELEYEPSVSGKFGIDSPLGRGFGASLDVRWMGRQKCENPEIGGLQPVDASASADVTIRRTVSLRPTGPLSRVDASASVRNVTDAVAFDQCGLPQPGRTFEIQFRIR